MGDVRAKSRGATDAAEGFLEERMGALKMKTARDDDWIDEAVFDLFRFPGQYFHRVFDTLDGIGGAIFDPNMIVWYAGFDELFGVDFSFG